MKYRSFPVISLFVTLPAWAIDGFTQLSSIEGIQIQFSPASASIGMQPEFGLPIEAGVMVKGHGFADNFEIPFDPKLAEKPELIQSVRLARSLTGVSVDVSRYASGQQLISFKSTGNFEPAKQQLSAEQQLNEELYSNYQQLLYLLIAHVTYQNLQLTYHADQPAFVFSSSVNPKTKLKVVSQADTTDFPEGALEGLTILHHTALTDLTSALECYNRSKEYSFFVPTIPCSNGNVVSWHDDEAMYVYEVSSPVPVPPDFPFTLSQFGFDESWPLSEEFALLFINNRPVKVTTIGSEDVSFLGEPQDTGERQSGNNKEGQHSSKTESEDTGPRQSGATFTAIKKKGRGADQGDDEDPDDRVTDYERKGPKPGDIDETLPQSTAAVVKDLAKVNEQIKKDEAQLESKWNKKASYNARKRIEVEKRLQSNMDRRMALLRQLDALERRGPKEPVKQPKGDDHTYRSGKAKSQKFDKASTKQMLKFERTVEREYLQEGV